VHELAIAHSLVRAAVEQAGVHGADRVLGLDLVLGALSGVEPDALAFCFPIAARETPCEGAELRMTVVPAMGRCDACGGRSPVARMMDPCPTCGGWPLEVEGGSEMTLHSVEIC
jgi:hydrogenase nickel incorporation protein HypA/HybF